MALEDSLKNDITRLIAIETGIMQSAIKPESRFIEDLRADSLISVELAIEIEDRYKIKVDDDEMPATKTVQNLYDLIEKKYTPTAP